MSLAMVLAACDGDLTFERSEAGRLHGVTAAGDTRDAHAPDTTVAPDTDGDTTSDPETVDTDAGPDAPDSNDTTDSVGPDVPDTTDTDTSVGPDTVDADTSPDTDVGPAPEGPVLYPPGQVHSPITADLAERLRDIAATDPALRDDVFMKVGASSFAQTSFVRCFAGNYNLDAHSHLEPTRAFFAAGQAANTNPFSRASLAAESGRNAGWAINGDPSPMEREYLAISPRYAFVMFGANDMGAAGSYEAALFLFGERMWTLVDELISWGVTPILMTIGRRLDSANADRWVATFNSVIRGLAQGRGVPLIDIFHAFRDLPNSGVGSDGLHASTFSGGACVLTPQGLQSGHNARNLATLESLARVEAVVVDHVAALDQDAPRMTGAGSPAEPFQIPLLPFTDMRSTATSPHSNLDVYDGCGAAQNERGPEWIYRIDVASRVRIRASVHDLGQTDVDLHLLGATPTTAACIQRHNQFIEATLDPGTYHFALDTFVSSNGAVRAGEYLFTIIDCDADPPGCR